MSCRDWRILMLLGVLSLLPAVCHAQTYQGPSGGSGGKNFDNWQETNGKRNIMSVSVYQDDSIRCLFVLYRVPRSTTVQTRAGYCDPEPGPLTINGAAGISLAPDEYLIGISGRYGDHINSIRFYTNKRTSPVFGGSGGSHDFSYTAPAKQMIVGFFGRAGDNLDAIGVIYAPRVIVDKSTRPTPRPNPRSERP